MEHQLRLGNHCFGSTFANSGVSISLQEGSRSPVLGLACDQKSDFDIVLGQDSSEIVTYETDSGAVQ